MCPFCDFVLAHFDCSFQIWGGFQTYRKTMASEVETSPLRVVRKSGNFIELDGAFSPEVLRRFGMHSNFYDNEFIHDNYEFFNCLNGGKLCYDFDMTVRPVSGYLMRAYATRVFKKRMRPIKDTVRFYLNEEDIPHTDIFVPKQETGAESNIISRETSVTPAIWRGKIARGEWFQYQEIEPKFDREFGVYEVHTKTTKCI